MMDPVMKDVLIPVSAEVAFKRFTDDLRSWWPMATHSVSGENCKDVRFDFRSEADGEPQSRILVEEDAEGTIHTWGIVGHWDPPRGFIMSWHPGRGPEEAQEIEVSFEPEAEGTRVRLVHRGWEALGERAAEVRERYDDGWIRVLQLLAG